MKPMILYLRRTGIILIAIVGVLHALHAQTVNNVVVPSPNASEIGRFGAVPVGMFTGSMQQDVPVYELGNANVRVPISLRYSSNGFTVDKVSSTVGYDWSLDAGGVINHYISGGPDSYISNNRDYSTQQTKTDLEKYYFLNNFDPIDNFTFSFPGGSGSFYLDNNGKPVPIKKGDNLSITYDLNAHQFTIKTSDGVQYIFADYAGMASQGFECWYLSSIRHPSGDHIDFTYSAVKSFTLGVVNRDVYFPILDSDNMMGAPYSTESMTNKAAVDRYVERIDLAGVGAVVFTNSYNRSDSQNEPKVDEITVLDEQGGTLRKVKLSYSFVQSNSQYDYHLIGNSDYPAGYLYHKYRMFLNKAEFDDNSGGKVYSYAFQYNDLNNLPCRHSYSKDFWGYFNGKNNTDALNTSDYFWVSTKYSTNTYLSLANLINTGKPDNRCDRSADYTFSQKGMLSRITYPTSGYSLIYYEGHKNEVDTQVGGCRVARVETFDSDNAIPEVKVYKYPGVMTNYDPTIYNKGEEFVLHPFVYTWGCDMVDATTVTKQGSFMKLSPNLQDNFTTGGYHLSYTKVEILNGANAENGSEEHEFWAVAQVHSYPIAGPPVNTPLKRFNTDLFNGTPTRVAYKKNNVVQKEIIYNYDFDNAKYKESVVCNSIYYNNNALKDTYYEHRDDGSYIARCSPVPFDRQLQFYDISGYSLYSNFPYLISKKETVTDDNANAVITETFYDYCDFPYTNVKSVTVKRSDEKDIKTLYKYPFDNTASLQGMVTANITSPVIEHQEYIVSNGQSLLKSVVSADYSQISTGFYLPTTVYQLGNQNPLGTGSYTTYANGLITRDANFDIPKQVSYDTRGNITRVLPSDGIPVSYLWGYNGNYPVAKIVNASPAEVAYTSFESTDLGGWSFSYITPANSPCQASCDATCTSAVQSSCSNTCASSCGGNPDCYNSCMSACGSGVYGGCMSNCLPGCNAGTVTIDASTAKTGSQSFKGTSISKTVPSGYYRLGYWAKKSGTSNGTVTINGSPLTITNSNWQYNEFITPATVTSIAVSLSGTYIDDIRVCPRDARITTYSYKPPIGMTSMTDENGVMTTYEYDPFGRLRLAKDNDTNIMKQYQYNYKNQ